MTARRLVRVAITAVAVAAPVSCHAEASARTIDPLPPAAIAREGQVDASPIPEPAGLMLLAAGLSSMVLMRRRLG